MQFEHSLYPFSLVPCPILQKGWLLCESNQQLLAIVSNSFFHPKFEIIYVRRCPENVIQASTTTLLSSETSLMPQFVLLVPIYGTLLLFLSIFSNVDALLFEIHYLFFVGGLSFNIRGSSVFTVQGKARDDIVPLSTAAGSPGKLSV